MTRSLITLALALSVSMLGCDAFRAQEDKNDAPPAEEAKPEKEKGEKPATPDEAKGGKASKPTDDSSKKDGKAEFGEKKEGKATLPTKPPIAWSVRQVEALWGTKMKSVGRVGRGHSLVLEFTRDLTEEELGSLKKSFGGRSDRILVMTLYLYDKDGVVVSALTGLSHSGVVTGVKGDAFRVNINYDFIDAGYVRAELRAVKPDGLPSRPKGRR